jgi:hypothetical protein
LFPSNFCTRLLQSIESEMLKVTVIAWRPSVALPINLEHLYVLPNKGSELFLWSGQNSIRASSLAYLLGSLGRNQPDSSPFYGTFEMATKLYVECFTVTSV